MKAIKKLSFLAAAALIACPSGFTTLAADGTDGYRDVEPAAWYYEAVDWARVNGIIGGDGNVFDPQGEITRAETASMLYHWRADGEEKNVTVNENDGILIAYFSHTGNTRGVAGDIAIDTVAEYLKKNGRIKKAVFDVFSDEDRQIYIEKFIDKKRNR